MLSRDPCPRRLPAFSLVEMLLALGIFAFCIVVVLGLLGSVMNSSKESWMESRATQIARQIMQDLAPDSAGDSTSTTHATPVAGMLMTVPNPVQINLAPAAATTNTAYYSEDGIPVAPSSTDAVFRAEIVVSPLTLDAVAGNLPARKVAQVRIDIRNVFPTNAESFLFITRITPSQSLP